MNIWQRFEKDKCTMFQNKGISFQYEKGIDSTLKIKYLNFANWLRKKYVFPVHITVYVVNRQKVKLLSGVWAYGSFR